MLNCDLIPILAELPRLFFPRKMAETNVGFMFVLSAPESPFLGQALLTGREASRMYHLPTPRVLVARGASPRHSCLFKRCLLHLSPSWSGPGCTGPLMVLGRVLKRYRKHNWKRARRSMPSDLDETPTTMEDGGAVYTRLVEASAGHPRSMIGRGGWMWQSSPMVPER
jgi:hypothetical protein